MINISDYTSLNDSELFEKSLEIFDNDNGGVFINDGMSDNKNENQLSAKY